jgi:hypothetical protein
MPTPPLSDEECRRAVDLVKQHGSITEAAIQTGEPRHKLRHRYETAKSRGLDVDPAIAEAKAAVGTNLSPVLAWAKTRSEDGTSYSVLLKPDQPSPEDAIDRIRAALEDMPAIPAIPAPQHCDSDLLTLYPIADAHIGMMAWGKETGEDYDLKTASERLISWMGQCVASSPASRTAIILDAGDLLHADDQTNQTPKSKHALDVDTRHYKSVETAISTLAIAIEGAARKHERVIVRILPGNHNTHSYIAVMFALAERYRDNPQIEVQKVPGEFFIHQFGKVLIAAHHGDKAKAERMVMFLADQYAGIWGRTLHRFLWTGHLHHHKSQDIGGCQWEQLRALTARDAYAVSHAYTARAQLQGITYHRTKGEVQRVKVGM